MDSQYPHENTVALALWIVGCIVTLLWWLKEYRELNGQ